MEQEINIDDLQVLSSTFVFARHKGLWVN